MFGNVPEKRKGKLRPKRLNFLFVNPLNVVLFFASNLVCFVTPSIRESPQCGVGFCLKRQYKKTVQKESRKRQERKTLEKQYEKTAEKDS